MAPRSVMLEHRTATGLRRMVPVRLRRWKPLCRGSAPTDLVTAGRRARERNGQFQEEGTSKVIRAVVQR